jgi:hypothetical protein
MKSDKYLLKHKSGRIIANFVVENDDGCLMGKCYEEGSDERFIVDVYCKADACTHWRFWGEDYCLGVPGNYGSYYHLCGSHCFTHHITAMCFVWKLAADILSNSMPERAAEIHDDYFDHERIGKLVDLMLDGYEIVKE